MKKKSNKRKSSLLSFSVKKKEAKKNQLLSRLGVGSWFSFMFLWRTAPGGWTAVGGQSPANVQSIVVFFWYFSFDTKEKYK
ncbi:MAG: hypothetical protein J6K72_11325 [Clostridia bacterium]|nr:hypothetical protein [Clostridia bacterium]